MLVFLGNEYPNHLDHLKFNRISLEEKPKQNMIKTGVAFSFASHFFLVLSSTRVCQARLGGVRPARVSSQS